jgi:hypothetical protein
MEHARQKSKALSAISNTVDAKKTNPIRPEHNFISGLIENKIIYEDSSASAAPSSPSDSSADGSSPPIGGELCSRYEAV